MTTNPAATIVQHSPPPTASDGSSHARVSVPRVAVIMAVRNEAAHLAASLGAVLAQDWPPDRLEVLVVDGDSTDGTAELASGIAARAAARGPVPRIRVLRNPSGHAAAGLNVALAAALRTGRHGDAPAVELPDFIVRVDGHAEIAEDFVRRAVDTLTTTGADAAGGPILTLPPPGAGAAGRAVALAMSTPFGAGSAAFRTGTAVARDTDTVAFAAYARGVFDLLGGFDESFPRNQDDEFHLRLTRHGGRIRLDPAIRATYRSRSGPVAAARQYFGYGFHKARLLRLHGRLPTLRGLAPPALVLALLATVAAAVLTGDARWLGAVAVPYAIASVVASAVAVAEAARRDRARNVASSTLSSPLPSPVETSPIATLLWLPSAYAALHVGYGVGFLVGVPAALVDPPVPRVPAPRSREHAERVRLGRLYALRDADPAVSARDAVDDPGHLWLLADRQRRLRSVLDADDIAALGDGSHLDVGCGRGASIPLLRALGARGHVVGLDALSGRFSGRARGGTVFDGSASALVCANAAHLPIRDGACASVLLATVASSIADPEIRRRAASEAIRALRPGGVVVWYDLRMRGRTADAISAGALRRMFPGCRVTVASAGLVPPLARAAARISPRLCDGLAAFPPLRSHIVAVVRRAAEVPPPILARGESRRRAIDVALALPALVVVVPVVAAFALLVRLDSPGPAIHRSIRVGRGGRTFAMLKLRTMAVGGSPDPDAPPLTAEGDPRVTRIGAFLRRTHIDELPQLWNVLRGDMAIVGPRPEAPVFVDASDARWQSVLAVRPGITGPTQLAFSPREGRRLTGPDPESAYRTTILPRKLRTDTTYLARRTTLTDLGWIARTAAAAWTGRRRRHAPR